MEEHKFVELLSLVAQSSADNLTLKLSRTVDAPGTNCLRMEREIGSTLLILLLLWGSRIENFHLYRSKEKC